MALPLLATLALRNAWRNKTRAVLTILGVMVAVTAFGFLRTVIDAYYVGVEASAKDRLVARNKVSLVIPLPFSYGDRIAQIPGVTRVAPASWFGGIYIEEKNFFANFAVDLEQFTALYPEYQIAADEKAALMADRTGCVVGDKLAKKFGWKVGDTVTLKGTIYPGDWKLTIRALYHPRDKSTDATQMFFHYKYLDEGAMPEQKGLPGLYFVGIADPNRSAEISRAIDARFQGSTYETLTESEKAFQLSFVSMASAVLTALKIVSAFVLLIVGLILGNTIAMSVRERTSELAIMRAVGFRGASLGRNIALESAIMGTLGGLLGLAVSVPIMRAFGVVIEENVGSMFPVFELKKVTIAAMIVMSALLGLLAAFVPAWRISGQKTADILRRVG